MEQTPIPIKSVQPQASKLAKEATEEEPVHKLESQLGPDPTPEERIHDPHPRKSAILQQ